jgi:hypothetical protein
VNRLPFSTLLSAVSRPKPPLVRDSERLVPEQSLSQGARWSNGAGPTNEWARNQGYFNSSRASAVVGNGEKLPSPCDARRSRGSRHRLAARTAHQHERQAQQEPSESSRASCCRMAPEILNASRKLWHWNILSNVNGMLKFDESQWGDEQNWFGRL